jgi:hypothetical protein
MDNLQLTDLSEELKDLKEEVSGFKFQVSGIEDLQIKIQEQIDELKKLTDQETNLAQIDLNKNDIDYIKLVLGIDTDRVEKVGDVGILGKFTAEEIETGALVVKIIDEEQKTIGEAAIFPVKTDANDDGLDDETVSSGKIKFARVCYAEKSD